MPLFFAAVADDDTGATDLAGMLADRGMHVILILDEPAPDVFKRWTQDADAIVIGTASRSIPESDAYSKTRRAVNLLRTLQPEVLQVKYCSTFDSTATGNIGPSVDAAMDETGEHFTVALPALPVNRRTTYMGYHFVDAQLLSDSSMRHHPLTPMTNPNLVSHLQSQTKRRVGLLPYADVKQGPKRIRERLSQLRSENIEIAVLDCISDEDLANICEGISDLRLVTGSSAPAMHLPRSWVSKERARRLILGSESGRGLLVVSGSYSEATRRQNEWLAGQGAHVTTLDAVELTRSGVPVPQGVCEALVENRTCLLQVSRDRERVHRYFQDQGKTEFEAGELISRGLADLVRRITQRVALEGMILAGGETSSIVARALGFGALRVGPNIEPGVPLCVTLTDSAMPVVFKSGNFGSDDFYGRAMDAIRQCRADATAN